MCITDEPKLEGWDFVIRPYENLTINIGVVFWKIPLVILAPLIFIWLKSYPEKSNLAATRIVIALAAKIIYFYDLSFLLLYIANIKGFINEV